MTTRFVETRRRITDALNGGGFDVREKGPRAWRIDNDGLGPREVDVEVVDGWLCLHEPLLARPDPPGMRECRSYVRARPFNNSRGKVALDPLDGGSRCREEIPLGDGIDLTEACRNAVSGFEVARVLLSEPKKAAAVKRRKMTAARRRPSRKDTAHTVGPDPAAGAFHDTLEDLCADTGWVWSKRGDGTPGVVLDIAGAGHQTRVERMACIEAVSASDYRITAELNHFKSPSAVVRNAVAVFLLTGFYRTLPTTLGEAAALDGCGEWRTFTRVYFPRLIIPVASVGAGLLDMLVSMGVLIGLMIAYGIAPTPALLAVPLLRVVWEPG